MGVGLGEAVGVGSADGGGSAVGVGSTDGEGSTEGEGSAVGLGEAVGVGSADGEGSAVGVGSAVGGGVGVGGVKLMSNTATRRVIVGGRSAPEADPLACGPSMPAARSEPANTISAPLSGLTANCAPWRRPRTWTRVPGRRFSASIPVSARRSEAVSSIVYRTDPWLPKPSP